MHFEAWCCIFYSPPLSFFFSAFISDTPTHGFPLACTSLSLSLLPSIPFLGLQSAVFQVRAQTKYKAQKNLRAALEQLRREQNRPELSLEDAMLNASEQLLELHALAEAEKHDNELEQERRRGDHVVYGQVVQLYHTFSQLYVRVSSTVTSPVEPSNMRIELDPNVSSYAWFRIMPRYKVRAEGERVRMGDQASRNPRV